MAENGDEGDVTVPPRGDYNGVSDRALLERAADNSMYAVEAVGQLTREMSGVKRQVDAVAHKVDGVAQELRRTTSGMRRKLQSLSDELDEDDDTKTHDLKAALKDARKSQTWWLRFAVTILVTSGVGALGATLSYFLFHR
jgi:hypothetical protein